MPDVYVVDTGDQEIYVLAEDEFEATAKVVATGEDVLYAEWYSNEPDDADIL